MNPIANSSSSLLGGLDSSYALPKPTQKDRTELGQEEFLMLMLTQFRHQDPLKPQDPAEFLTQLAQVSSVAGISEMNKSVGTLADSLYAGQALQAASVVGRDVLAPAASTNLAEHGSLRGAVDLPVSIQSGFVRVFDAAGTLVRELPLGARAAGLADFRWDGTDNSGDPAPAGSYQVTAGYRNGGEEFAVETYIAKRVASVSLGGDGQRTEITTADNQKLGLADIRAIY